MIDLLAGVVWSLSRFERGVHLGHAEVLWALLQWSFSDMHRSEGQIQPLARRASSTRMCWLCAVNKSGSELQGRKREEDLEEYCFVV